MVVEVAETKKPATEKQVRSEKKAPKHESKWTHDLFEQQSEEDWPAKKKVGKKKKKKVPPAKELHLKKKNQAPIVLPAAASAAFEEDVPDWSSPIYAVQKDEPEAEKAPLEKNLSNLSISTGDKPPIPQPPSASISIKDSIASSIGSPPVMEKTFSIPSEKALSADVASDKQPSELPPPTDQPRVRRGISQASKDQIFASLARSGLPLRTAGEKNPSTTSPLRTGSPGSSKPHQRTVSPASSTKPLQHTPVAEPRSDLPVKTPSPVPIVKPVPQKAAGSQRRGEQRDRDNSRRLSEKDLDQRDSARHERDTRERYDRNPREPKESREAGRDSQRQENREQGGERYEQRSERESGKDQRRDADHRRDRDQDQRREPKPDSRNANREQHNIRDRDTKEYTRNGNGNGNDFNGRKNSNQDVRSTVPLEKSASEGGRFNLEKRLKQKKNLELPRRNNNVTTSASESTIVETSPIPVVQEPKVVATPNGWALLNPGPTPAKEEPARNVKAGTKGKTNTYEQQLQQSGQRAYKSKRQTPQSETLPYTPAVQPMINVQPMMTQSGHMVLMTEDGLCVPATPGMFQYQDWYNNSNVNAPPPPAPVEQQSPNPYYYTTNYYAPKKEDSS